MEKAIFILIRFGEFAVRMERNQIVKVTKLGIYKNCMKPLSLFSLCAQLRIRDFRQQQSIWVQSSLNIGPKLLHYRKRFRRDERTEGGAQNVVARRTRDERTVGRPNLNSRQNPATKPPPPPKKQQRDGGSKVGVSRARRAYCSNYHSPRAYFETFKHHRQTCLNFYLHSYREV